MRRFIALAATLTLTACFNAPQEPPPLEHLRGCWIGHEAGATQTMRWFPDRVRDGYWTGDLLIYPVNAEPLSSQFTLEQRHSGWMVCGLPPSDKAEAQTACRLLGKTVLIDAGPETLTITDTRRADAIVFRGQRDGCD